MKFTAAEVVQFTNGEILVGVSDAQAQSWSIDTRSLQPGAGFFALHGIRDGHDFIETAFINGAALAVVARADRQDCLDESRQALVRVADPAIALVDIAREARRRLTKAIAVGITGSAGKTTTKDLTAAALSTERKVHANEQSFNNEVGTPLTLLSAPENTEVLITEMGARKAGNITELADLVKPSIGVITNIGMAHAEYLGGRTGIAAVKSELVVALPESGLAILNADCDQTASLSKLTSARVVTVGQVKSADIVVSDINLDEEMRPSFSLKTDYGSVSIRLELRGAHHAVNAAMAAAVALELGINLDVIVVNLQRVRAAKLRMEVTKTESGITVIDDSYNSSPTSATAALTSLASLKVSGRRWAVLGEMRELGEYSEAEHATLGAQVSAAGVDCLVAVGDRVDAMAAAARSGGVMVNEVKDAQEAIAILDAEAKAGDAVLVKASRAIGLEVIAEHLIDGGQS